MTRIDIISGFLGAGKTTLIKKLISEAYKGEKVVLIENEFGEIGIDGGFLKDAGIEITEMNSGCICCSLVGDFGKALCKVIAELSPDRIVIEPSGVGKLSDVIAAVKNANAEGAVLGGYATVVDAKKCKMYMKNFGEFFGNQVENANAIVLSHTKGLSDARLSECVEILRNHNPKASIITTDFSELSAEDILKAMENASEFEKELEKLKEETEHHHHEHHHHHHDEECDCGCNHEHHHEHEHEHHHHHHDEECDCGCNHEHHHEHEHEHHHHHHHDEECDCGCNHEHHHHHHADEVFTSWGRETVKKYELARIEEILSALDDTSYGLVLRAKGIVENVNGGWIYFDYVPGEPDVREGAASTIGKLCVIGSSLDEKKLSELFGL